ncbi:hypothetical protein K437DRAFT_252451 [Tilletiaria anomala UBC 951]|uniref:Uncharacterized protein n=1 Tax=Tilletiaria anomala (strain ATCC 24038 / CBS 436.72 / UBC 951) TaxID=1037660 RepID=A0A066VCQ6_TILAU|nr:uncharacterized protein K437DRAFT_252451 [Tilletiaria anomala UBC 951]KDN36330.1 hypothetical protein K437DRAFT_252451 [Tilletiaria anomala UBC 951]
MPSYSGKAKARGQELSSSSFLSLKADLAEKRRQSTRGHVHGLARTDAAGFIEESSNRAGDAMASWKKPEKRLPAHLRPSPGVLSRADKAGEVDKGKGKMTTSRWASTPSAELERERERVAALQRKAEMYDKLKRGLHGGLTEQEREKALGLVDWERKMAEKEEDGGSDDDSCDAGASGSEYEGEGRRTPEVHTTSDDPIIEYVDDFGRTRTARRSKVPLHLLPISGTEGLLDDTQRTAAAFALPSESLVSYGRQTAFPVYRPPSPTLAERKAAIEAKQSVGASKHFDAKHEIRNRGAAFYQFSKDEGERRRQMEMLRAERKSTERERRLREAEGVAQEKDLGATDDPFADVERKHGRSIDGQVRPQGDSSSTAPVLSSLPPQASSRPLSTAQKRLADRRAEVEAKRRKLLGDAEVERRKKEQQVQRVEKFLNDIVTQAKSTGQTH